MGVARSDEEESSRSRITYLHCPACLQPCMYRSRLECLRLNGWKFDCRYQVDRPPGYNLSSVEILSNLTGTR